MPSELEVLRQLVPGPQSVSLGPRVRGQVVAQDVPTWHELNKDVFVRAYSGIVIKCSRRDLDVFARRGSLRHRTPAVRTERRLVWRRFVQHRRGIRPDKFSAAE